MHVSRMHCNEYKYYRKIFSLRNIFFGTFIPIKKNLECLECAIYTVYVSRNSFLYSVSCVYRRVLYLIHLNCVALDLGRALVFHHAFVCFGVFYAHSLSAIVTNAQLTGLCMVWPALHLFISVFMPESPLYAYKCYGDSEHVKAVMRRVKGPDYDVDSDFMALEVFVRKPNLKRLDGSCPVQFII